MKRQKRYWEHILVLSWWLLYFLPLQPSLPSLPLSLPHLFHFTPSTLSSISLPKLDILQMKRQKRYWKHILVLNWWLLYFLPKTCLLLKLPFQLCKVGYIFLHQVHKREGGCEGRVEGKRRVEEGEGGGGRG